MQSSTGAQIESALLINAPPNDATCMVVGEKIVITSTGQLVAAARQNLRDAAWRDKRDN